ncbi:hypothetical protein HYFRA_00011030 [Hymenoscyphus fraxineus]|uniref:Uncharacterized protein n=1 Tax=Hymenoscyphus fraxineus TaxID=746836 RepID=A0A9N9L572_9HELO|nr:hypothetical protein HYFRA_00011030 [Hymenoscyphus fraxineus]
MSNGQETLFRNGRLEVQIHPPISRQIRCSTASPCLRSSLDPVSIREALYPGFCVVSTFEGFEDKQASRLGRLRRPEGSSDDPYSSPDYQVR